MEADGLLLERIAFFAFSAMAVVAAIFVVVHRNPVTCAVSLVTVFLAVAGLYLTLGATFLTAVQILVYAGAIMVLFLFVIMLLNLEKESFEQPRTGRLVGTVLAIVLVFGVVTLVSGISSSGESLQGGSGKAIGKIFFSDYLFPFEIASLLLLIAMIGAIVVARRQPDGEGS